jgi:hypothetical protein
MGTIEVGTVKAKPGTKNFGCLKIAMRYDGTALSIPLIVVNGLEDGGVLCIDACMDGDEIEGILAVIEIAKKIDPQNLRGTFIAVPVLNVPACSLVQRTAGVFDIFGGTMYSSFTFAVQGITTRIAAEYFRSCVSKADYVISHHSGGSYMYTVQSVVFNEAVSKSIELAKAMGPEWTILQKFKPSPGSFFAACSDEGIPSVVTELGGGGGRLPNILEKNVNKLVDADINVMRHLDMIEGEPKYAKDWTFVDKGHGVYSSNEGFIKYTKICRLGVKVTSGITLAKIFTFLGEETETIKAPLDGVVMGIRTHPVVHPGDQVISLGRVL